MQAALGDGRAPEGGGFALDDCSGGWSLKGAVGYAAAVSTSKRSYGPLHLAVYGVGEASSCAPETSPTYAPSALSVSPSGKNAAFL